MKRDKLKKTRHFFQRLKIPTELKVIYIELIEENRKKNSKSTDSNLGPGSLQLPGGTNPISCFSSFQTCKSNPLFAIEERKNIAYQITFLGTHCAAH